MQLTIQELRSRFAIERKRHYVTRFPVGVALIIFIGLSPWIIGVAGSWLTEWLTGLPCHEGNCGWMVLPWFTFLTLPIGGIFLVLYLIAIFSDTIKLIDEKKSNG